MYPYTTSDKPLISLALQGIGHGAFTWGVMDALMESDSVRFRDIAATGSDTITALLAVYGLRTGGATKARTLMRNFWTGLDSMAVWGPVDLAWAHMAVTGEPPPENLTQLKVASPGEPMSTEEVYVVLEDLYKPAVFAGEHGPVLHLCTMEADTGNLFVFTGRDISYESAMAASCLSELSPAITVGNRDYWSAHILGHAALSALIHASRSEDVVLLNPDPPQLSTTPMTPMDVARREHRLRLRAALRQELAGIDHINKMISAGQLDMEKCALRPMRLHAIGHDDAMLRNRVTDGAEWSKLIRYHHILGRKTATQWLQKHLADIGTRTSYLNAGGGMLSPC